MQTRSPQSGSLPRSVAISGIVFSILFFLSLAIIRLSVPSDPRDSGIWLADSSMRQWIGYALNLVPFCGITFLWFMGVLRARIGVFEDRLFSTVFLGSGYLFVAMLFAAGAASSGLIEAFSDGSPGENEAYRNNRAMAFSLMNTFAMKMAAMFIFVTSSIGLRTKVLAHWVSYVGFGSGVILLLAIRDFAWIELLFPVWVLVVSLHILCTGFRQGEPDALGEESEHSKAP